MSLIGLPLLGFATNVGARYFGVFLATTACNANVPCKSDKCAAAFEVSSQQLIVFSLRLGILTFQANNIRGQWKRALASATLVGAGGIGGIIGSTVFRSQDEPGYVPGIITCMM
jgi:hypothetical protein